MERICEFCKELKLRKECARKDNRGQSEENRLKYAYNVALVQHMWTKKKGKRNACRSVDFRNQGIGYQFNYCPECGRRLRGKE